MIQGAEAAAFCSENGDCSWETSERITKNYPINLKTFTEKTCPENSAYYILVFGVEKVDSMGYSVEPIS